MTKPRLSSSTFIVLSIVVVLAGIRIERFAAATRSHAIVALPAPQMPGQGNTALFGEPASPRADALPSGPTLFRQRWVTINFDQIRETLPTSLGGTQRAQALTLNLFPDTQFVAVLERVEKTATGYVWVGRLANVAFSTVKLAITGRAMAGSVTTGDAAYTIRPVDDSVHIVQELNQSAFPPEAPPLVPSVPPGTAPGVPSPPAAADILASPQSIASIDVLVVYTPAARAAQGGTAAIEALIDLGVSETNQAYANSGALQRINLVHKQEVSYTESGSMYTDLPRLQDPSDGYLDTVHSLRDTYAADLVQLIENSTDFCGIAYFMSNVSPSFAPNAFGITHYNCISPNYSFAHEMGHNMGLGHDTYVDSGTLPYPYSHGYVNQAAFTPGAPDTKRWRDILAYANQCGAAGFGCARLPFFSNPSMTYTGDPMGNVSTADAVTSLNNTRSTVASFRSPLPPIQWTSGNGHYYQLFTRLAGFTEAQAAATGLGGYLATVTSAPENSFIATNFLTTGTPLWLGGFQSATNPGYSEGGGGWAWLTGEAVGYTNWNSLEPGDTANPGGIDINGDEDHLGMSGSGTWFDINGNIPYNAKLFYVVEWDTVLPAITTHPAGQTMAPGQTVTLSVAATGMAVNYQWYIGMSGATGNPIPGATASSYTTPALMSTTSYWVRVSNAYGDANSNTATIMIGTPPTITTQPAGQTIPPGQTATVCVAAAGTAPLSYQWWSWRLDTPIDIIPGATASCYTAPAVMSTTGYRVRVSNDFGQVTSNMAMVTVASAPTITTQPASQTIAPGQTATLCVVAAGTAALRYQWWSWRPNTPSEFVQGATGSCYTTPALMTTTGYRVRVSNDFPPDVDSNMAMVTVPNVAITLVDFGSTSSTNTYGIAGWSSAIKDVYTDNRNLGPGGTTIVTGNNYSYNYQGVRGTTRSFSVDDRIIVTWYNNSPTGISFTPKISFTDPDRIGGGAAGAWYNMTSVSIPAFAGAASEYIVTSSSAGLYSLVNVNVNYSNNQVVVADKIQLLAANNAPGQPTNLVARSPVVGRVDLTWTDNSSAEFSFDIGRGGLGITPFSPGFQRVQSVPANVTATSITGLTDPGVSHHWYVRACDFHICSEWFGPVGKNADGSDGVQSSRVTLVDFGSSSSTNNYGLAGWSTAIKDTYTENRNWGPGGTTIVVGDNYSYNYQGVTGTSRSFIAGEKILVTWYNNSAANVSFTPKVSFTDPDRISMGAAGAWYDMTSVSIPPLGSATSEYIVISSSAGAYSLVNVNVNYSNTQVVVADKIELVR